MIPVAALAELIPAAIAIVRWVRGLLPDEDEQRLIAWANLLKAGPKQGEPDNPDWQRDVNQFLVNLTTRKGYSPAYQYSQWIDVPEDLLTDLVDLLVGGWSAGGKWSPAVWLRNPVKDRQAWRATMASGNDTLIIAEADDWLAKRGRSRDYSPVPRIRADRDHFADMVSTLVG